MSHSMSCSAHIQKYLHHWIRESALCLRVTASHLGMPLVVQKFLFNRD